MDVYHLNNKFIYWEPYVNTGFLWNILRVLFYILENFEEFLFISGRENALRVTRNVDIPCRNLLAIIQPSPLKTGELPFSVRSAKYYFKIRCSNGCFFSISYLFYMFAHKNGSFRFVKLTTFVTVVLLICHWTCPHLT